MYVYNYYDVHVSDQGDRFSSQSDISVRIDVINSINCLRDKRNTNDSSKYRLVWKRLTFCKPRRIVHSLIRILSFHPTPGSCRKFCKKKKKMYVIRINVLMTMTANTHRSYHNPPHNPQNNSKMSLRRPNSNRINDVQAEMSLNFFQVRQTSNKRKFVYIFESIYYVPTRKRPFFFFLYLIEQIENRKWLICFWRAKNHIFLWSSHQALLLSMKKSTIKLNAGRFEF